jgi:predicted PurR-regulated permease PerM
MTSTPMREATPAREAISARDQAVVAADRARQAWLRLGLRVRGITPSALAHTLLVAGAVALFFWLLWRSQGVLIPFAVGAALAYVLAPVVGHLARWMPRWAAILLVLAGFTVLFLAFLLYLVPPLVHQIAALTRALPNDKQMAAFAHQVDSAIKSLPKGPRTIITDILSQAERAVKANLANLVTMAVSVVTTVLFGAINMILFLLGFTVVPIWLFFVLESEHAGRDAVNRVLPEGMRADAWAILRIADRILSSWIRGQILLSLFMGVALFLGLELLTLVGVKGIQYPLLIAVFAALVAPIPYVGNAIGAAPALVIGFLSSWQSGLAVLVLFIIVSNLHDSVLSPKIMSKHLNIHPAILMPLMIMLGQFGLIWVILAGPIAAVVRDLFLYVYGRFDDPPRPAGVLPGEPLPQAIPERGPSEEHAGRTTRSFDGDALSIDSAVTTPSYNGGMR